MEYIRNLSELYKYINVYDDRCFYHFPTYFLLHKSHVANLDVLCSKNGYKIEKNFVKTKVAHPNI